jgi:hypothetical protein
MSGASTNPFSARSKGSNPFTSRGTGNPFSSRTKKNTSQWSMVKKGMRVRIKWDYDPMFGIGTGVFEGKVIELDDWATIKGTGDKKGRIWHWPKSVVRSVEIL